MLREDSTFRSAAIESTGGSGANYPLVEYNHTNFGAEEGRRHGGPDV